MQNKVYKNIAQGVGCNVQCMVCSLQCAVQTRKNSMYENLSIFWLGCANFMHLRHNLTSSSLLLTIKVSFAGKTGLFGWLVNLKVLLVTYVHVRIF